MPKTLIPVNAFPTDIPNFPIAGNNEPVAIGPLENAIQAVLNRTENLHLSRQVVETTGVKRIQRVASLSALQSLTGMADQDVVTVDGYGLYRLFNPSALTADGLWVVAASGGGRWVHINNLLRGANNGLATLDSSGRLAQDVRDGSILTAHLGNLQVTGAKIADNTISGAKLAAGAAVANIGYNPVNRAGDTMTGDLINTQRLFVHRQVGAGPPTISLALGDDDTGFNWFSDGVVQIRANNTELAFWNSVELQFKAGKRLNFESGLGSKINFGGNVVGSKAHINFLSGYLGSEFNTEYGFNHWYLSTGFSQPDISGSIAVPGDLLGTNYFTHLYAKGAMLGVYTVSSSSNARIYFSQANIDANAQFRVEPSQVVVRARLVPDADNVVNWRLGDNGLRWSSVWAANGTIQTSDARLKTDVTPSPLGLDFIRRLQPVRYRWIEGGKERVREFRVGEDGVVTDQATLVSQPGRRLHYGLIAQQVKAVLDEIEAGDFGGWGLDDVNDPESTQSLRYDQFIAPLIKAVQELDERLERLENRKRRK
ncbi:MAG: tail fiber domain-containing protein [Meiothermus sp.]|nr:tail fiber domain-containing protein [Meiothermus sp.]